MQTRSIGPWLLSLWQKAMRCLVSPRSSVRVALLEALGNLVLGIAEEQWS